MKKNLLSSFRLALFQPDIPQNTGTILRMGACLGISVDIIEPCGFLWDDRKLRRAGMDYPEHADWQRHSSWNAFLETRRERGGRLLLLSTKASMAHTDFVFEKNDTLLLGRESAGVPPSVAETADAALRIPMMPECRSLNVAVAAALAAGEALRQLGEWPHALSERSPVESV